MGLRALTGVALLSASVVAAPAAGLASAQGDDPRSLVGQRLVVSMGGTTPSPGLLGRVRRGEVGGVILFGGNISGRVQLRSLTAALQAAARSGGWPPLLVAVDQEGGDIRRLLWAGPSEPAAALGRSTPVAVRGTAKAAGRALRQGGVNLNLAPVADVSVAGSFMAAEQRTFSADPARVGAMVAAFVEGLADARVAATVKHFPGIGRATRSTDRAAVTITARVTALQRDLAPFRRAFAAGVPVVMLSNAAYSAYGPAPATWSTRIQTLLRRELGFGGVTITDALEPAAATRRRALSSAAVLAARAGVDLILLTGTEESSDAVYRTLLERARDGTISAASLRRSYDRVVTLKQRLG